MNTTTLPNLNVTLAEAESYMRGGLWSQREFNRFLFAWTWSTPRHSGSAGIKHDQYWNRYGAQAYFRRLNRVRRALGFNVIK